MDGGLRDFYPLLRVTPISRLSKARYFKRKLRLSREACSQRQNEGPNTTLSSNEPV